MTEFGRGQSGDGCGSLEEEMHTCEGGEVWRWDEWCPLARQSQAFPWHKQSTAQQRWEMQSKALFDKSKRSKETRSIMKRPGVSGCQRTAKRSKAMHRKAEHTSTKQRRAEQSQTHSAWLYLLLRVGFIFFFAP